MAEPRTLPLGGPQEKARIEQQAGELARRVLEQWSHSGADDSASLLNDVQRVFLDEANHALRQILFQISARLELALVRARREAQPPTGLDDNVVLNLLDAVERATRIVDTYLDRSRAAQFTINLQNEHFDLAHDVRDFLKWNGFLDQGEHLRLDLKPALVHADRERLRDVLGHLASRFWFSRRPDQNLVVRIHPSPSGGVEGLIGLDHSRMHAEELIDEFDHPFSIEAMEIDVPYTRAVLERHGGMLYIAVNDDQTIGFGFTLPATPALPWEDHT